MTVAAIWPEAGDTPASGATSRCVDGPEARSRPHITVSPAGPCAADGMMNASAEDSGMPPKKKRVYVADAQEFIALFQELPPVIARSHVEKLFGGLFTRKTLANLDAAGKGPDISYSVGKTIMYRRDSLLQWILETYDIKRMHTIKNLGV